LEGFDSAHRKSCHGLPNRLIGQHSLYFGRRKLQDGGDGVEHVRLRGRIGTDGELEDHVLEILEIGAFPRLVPLQSGYLFVEMALLLGRFVFQRHRRHLQFSQRSLQLVPAPPKALNFQLLTRQFFHVM